MDLEGLADDAKKENIVSIVTLLSRVDGEVHTNELLYILKLGLSLGLSEDKIKEIVNSGEKFIYIPETESDRVTLLYYLIYLIKVDGIIDTEEVNMLHHFGLKLGFSPLLISNVIDVIKSQSNVEVTPNDILNEVKKYLN